jgi:hypothetical protein
MTRATRINRFKCGNVLVCEYVRPETNNKHTIIGAMSGDILVQSFPANIAIAFYVEIFFPEVGVHKLVVSVYYNSFHAAQFQLQLDVKDIALPGIIVLPTFLLPMTVEGDLEVRGRLDSGREQPIAKRRVRFGAVQLPAALPAA